MQTLIEQVQSFITISTQQQYHLASDIVNLNPPEQIHEVAKGRKRKRGKKRVIKMEEDEEEHSGHDEEDSGGTVDTLAPTKVGKNL